MNLVFLHEKKSKLFSVIAGILSVALIGIIDFLTGYEIAFSLFYLFPIAYLTWFGGRRFGIVGSIASALVWLIADVASGNSYSSPLIYYWNTAIRFSFFLIVTLLLSALRKAHENEKELARLDHLTGAANARYFSELVTNEIERSRRTKRPFTVAYFDLDNFKSVNDRFGHSAGDRVLSTIVRQVGSQLRKTDIVARLGGDEFAILMLETDQALAQVTIHRVGTSLLDEMRRNNWPVTFSMGVLTCIDIPQTYDELIQRADDLMYAAKNSGKNSILCSVYGG